MRVYRGESHEADGWERMVSHTEGRALVPIPCMSKGPHREAVVSPLLCCLGRQAPKDLSIASATQISANGLHNGSIL